MTISATNPARFVAVIDIGKTNAKLALVDLEARAEIAALRQPNRPLPANGGYPEHDVHAIWDFMLDGLAELRRRHRIDAISVTTHGATAVLLNAVGNLALPVLDYEFAIPEMVRGHYDVIRPDFSESGSPALPLGLNLGAQLYWLQDRYPGYFGAVTAILLYPQYWSWRLTGVMASEATSLGCHTDLWNPHKRDFSTLVDIMDWRPLFPPLKPAGAVLGPILPGLASYTGLDPRTPVICGIHDSNASLLPHLLDRRPPFAVVSTGTWVISMAVGGHEVALDPARDTLVNVNALGDPVPSARFMGGREFEQLLEGRSREWSPADLSDVLGAKIMLLPAVVTGSGPFPGRKARWVGAEPDSGARFVAVSFYLALMTATCLNLAGAEGDVIVEGPFATNEPYIAMLEAATGRAVVAGGGGTGTSIGAALLAAHRRTSVAAASTDHRAVAESLRNYARKWLSEVAAVE
ncbi:MAG: FGGY-family carbohydrate kinase [Rhizobiaceae bacterium]|nr:FGGY-family carbohydrate kinase [Rhizobiaceae bacterium]